MGIYKYIKMSSHKINVLKLQPKMIGP